MKRLLLFILVASLLILSACSSKEISAGGRINHYDQNGGFYGITTTHGGKYEPVNLSPEFQKGSGLPVSFKARILDDQTNTHGWGTAVQILEIKVDYSVC